MVRQIRTLLGVSYMKAGPLVLFHNNVLDLFPNRLTIPHNLSGDLNSFFSISPEIDCADMQLTVTVQPSLSPRSNPVSTFLVSRTVLAQRIFIERHHS